MRVGCCEWLVADFRLQLKDFNKDVLKKTVSPYKKWAYVEAAACFFVWEDMSEWMGKLLSHPVFL